MLGILQAHLVIKKIIGLSATKEHAFFFPFQKKTICTKIMKKIKNIFQMCSYCLRCLNSLSKVMSLPKQKMIYCWQYLHLATEKYSLLWWNIFVVTFPKSLKWRIVGRLVIDRIRWGVSGWRGWVSTLVTTPSRWVRGLWGWVSGVGWRVLEVFLRELCRLWVLLLELLWGVGSGGKGLDGVRRLSRVVGCCSRSGRCRLTGSWKRKKRDMHFRQTDKTF